MRWLNVSNLTSLLTLSLALLVATPVIAATVHEDFQATLGAEVVEILSDEVRELPGLETNVRVQEVSVLLTSGDRAGETVAFVNELTPLSVGDRIFVDYSINIQGDERFVFKDVDRRTELVVLALLMIVLVLWFSGFQGIRALASLAVSVAAILFVLVPALLAGYNPALVSLAICGAILATVLFGTHGVNAQSVLAAVGTFTAVALTCVLTYVFVSAMRFNGFSSDEAVFLNFSTGGSLDFAGLLLGSIIIGMLGVLDDVSITQASVVAELKAANQSLNPRELYRRAIRVGRDHVGSLVNTLALAYVGVSLPLILLLSRAETSLTLTLNQELVAVEMARIMLGSIGLILAVPLTTALSAWYFGTHEVTGEVHTHHHHH